MKDQLIVIKQIMRRISLFLFTTTLVTIVFMSTAFAQEANGNKVGLTSGRLQSIAIGVLGLASVILSVRYIVRSSNNPVFDSRRRANNIAALLGIICIILAIVRLATTAGSFSTGGGKAGAIVAMIFGLTGTIISGLSLSRLRNSV